MIKHYDLTVSGMEDLENYLNSIITGLKFIDGDIVEELGDKAHKMVSDFSFMGVPGEHHSVQASTQQMYSGRNSFGANEVTVFQTDPQSVYYEYGTGIIGANSPHPNPWISWDYDVNNHGLGGWDYPWAGGYIHTTGMPAHAQFEQTYIAIQDMLMSVALKHIRKVVNIW